MSSTTTQDKKRRRKRMATPPPEADSELVSEDIYDQTVAKTFDTLQSGKLEIPYNEVQDVNMRLVASNTENISEGLQALDNIESPSADLVVISNENPPSPPPPDQHPSQAKKHCPGRALKAAFAKLENCGAIVAIDDIINHQIDPQQEQNLLQNTMVDCHTVNHLKVRIKAPSITKRYLMKGDDTFCQMKNLLAQQEQVPVSKIMLMVNDTPINEDDTVETLGLKFTDTVECLILREATIESQQEAAGTINIKVQGKHGQRDVLNIQILPTRPLEQLMKEFAENKKLELSKLSFHFDGEEVHGTDTAADLDMEDGDCIDVSGY